MIVGGYSMQDESVNGERCITVKAHESGASFFYKAMRLKFLGVSGVFTNSGLMTALRIFCIHTIIILCYTPHLTMAQGLS